MRLSDHLQGFAAQAWAKPPCWRKTITRENTVSCGQTAANIFSAFSPRVKELLAIFIISAGGTWVAAANTRQFWRAEMVEIEQRLEYWRTAEVSGNVDFGLALT